MSKVGKVVTVVGGDGKTRHHDADSFKMSEGVLFIFSGQEEVAVYRDWASAHLDRGSAVRTPDWIYRGEVS